jgi:mono/diheme cytochrome c family protein
MKSFVRPGFARFAAFAFKAMIAVWLLVACASMWSFEVRAGQESAARTTWSGVYTDAQATRGETVYAQQCAGCHAPDLSGDGQAPPLQGKDFNTGWNDTAMSDLFERIRVSMPADAPGSLKPPDIADLLAFLLSKGGFPAGQTELPSEVVALKPIKFLTQKP